MNKQLIPPTRKSVLVFAGLDCSGGAGLSADIEAIGATGAHALPIATALTVQDNDHVVAVNPVSPTIWRYQADVLIKKMNVAAIKIGAIGNRENAESLAQFIRELRLKYENLPVVLDTVLGSGHGDLITEGRAEFVVAPLLPLATIATPNLLEATRLAPKAKTIQEQAQVLFDEGCDHVLIKGGHGDNPNQVINTYFTKGKTKSWTWPRLEGTFHGSGCTLASLIAGYLAQNLAMVDALEKAQEKCQTMLATSFAIAEGQRIPNRHF